MEYQSRDYQNRIVNKTVNYFREGIPSVGITSPTGSGKTICAFRFLEWVENNHPELTVNWVAMRRQLLRQAADTNNKFFGLKNVRFVSMFDKNPPKSDIIVMDECVTADTKLTVLKNNEEKLVTMGDVMEDETITHVLSMNENGVEEFQNIDARVDMGMKEIYEVVVESPTPYADYEYKLNITGNGKIYVNGNYIRVDELQGNENVKVWGDVCDRIINGKIKKITKLETQQKTYDIEVRKNHNFFANNILIHNCQHTATESFNNVSNWELKFLLGMSATPVRTDKLKLPFNKVVKDAGIHRLIQEGWLSKYEHWCIEEYTPQSVAEVYLENIEKWGKTCVFFHKISQCVEFADILASKGVRAEVVRGDDSNEHRENQLDAFENGEYNVVVNVAILTEGFDSPSLKTVFVRDSAKLPTIQMGGRGFRIHESKTHCNIVQSKLSKWQFVKTAKPTRCWVRKNKEWFSLGNNEIINDVARGMARQLMDIDIEMPSFIIKNRKKKKALLAKD